MTNPDPSKSCSKPDGVSPAGRATETKAKGIEYASSGKGRDCRRRMCRYLDPLWAGPTRLHGHGPAGEEPADGGLHLARSRPAGLLRAIGPCRQNGYGVDRALSGRRKAAGVLLRPAAGRHTACGQYTAPMGRILELYRHRRGGRRSRQAGDAGRSSRVGATPIA